jgi:hypothetical protein
MEPKLKFPTEQIELPSKGLIYPSDSPLSSGTIEMKYMTAKEEDILTNVNYINQNIVIDKLLQSLIISDVKYNELLVGDANSLLVAARILGYGKDYEFEYTDPETGNKKDIVVDLTTLNPKPLDESIFVKGKNEFDFVLPSSKIPVTFKLLTQGDQKAIEKEMAGLKRINPKSSSEITTRLKHMIVSLNGDRSPATIREFVDNMLVRDSQALRNYYNKISPDLELKFNYVKDNGDVVEGVNIPLNVSFLLPDTRS